MMIDENAYGRLDGEGLGRVTTSFDLAKGISTQMSRAGRVVSDITSGQRKLSSATKSIGEAGRAVSRATEANRRNVPRTVLPTYIRAKSGLSTVAKQIASMKKAPSLRERQIAAATGKPSPTAVARAIAAKVDLTDPETQEAMKVMAIKSPRTMRPERARLIRELAEKYGYKKPPTPAEPTPDIDAPEYREGYMAVSHFPEEFQAKGADLKKYLMIGSVVAAGIVAFMILK